MEAAASLGGSVGVVQNQNSVCHPTLENLGLVFPARVELSQQSISVAGAGRPLTAGMAVTAEIRTGRRRIIEFLLSPIARRVEEAGRER